MTNLTRKEFLLICGAGLTGIIGTSLTIKPKTEERTEYITNLQVNPNEFLLLQNQDKFYIALGGIGLIQGEENEFVDELISKNIVDCDACDIHELPKAQETDTTSFDNLTISTDDGLNYTLSSKNKNLIKSTTKYSSDILAHNYELFGQISKTR